MSSPTSEEQSKKIIRSFHVVTKPIGSLCNMNCTYCYYLHKEDLLQDTTATEKGDSPIFVDTKIGTVPRISDELLEEFIR